LNLLLFKAAGDSIVALDDMVEFWPQALSNIAWAYATAGKKNPWLFKYVVNHIVALKDLSVFNSKDLSNIAWAYTTAGESHYKLYASPITSLH
jgi:hypothetical protein